MLKNKYPRYTLILVLITLLFIMIANRAIKNSYQEFISADLNKLPECKTAVVLGCNTNTYFYKRINAALELFRTGKVKYFIVSGDNHVEEYNEPKAMKEELVKNGIPDSLIFLDYAGFRTFDSMIRAKEIFGQQKFIVVSQEFHNQRAVYIARENG